MILYMSETICRLIAHFVHAQNHTFHFNSNSQILKFKFISYHHHIKYIQSLTIMQTSLGSASLEKTSFCVHFSHISQRLIVEGILIDRFGVVIMLIGRK